MTRLLLQKAFYESALLLASCASLLFLFCWIRVWVVCQFDLQQLQGIIEQLRRFERFIPVPLEQLLTYRGSIAMVFHEPILILCVLVWSIARGSDAVSGEINRGTMEMLLAQPVGRLRWLACHTSVCIVGLIGLCGMCWLGLACGVHTLSVQQQVAPTVEVSLPFLPWKVPLQVGPSQPVETPLATYVDANQFIAPTCNLFAMSFFVLGLSLFCSSWDRYRWRTLGIVMGIFIVQFLLQILSKATDATAFVGNFTFLSAYKPDAMVHFASQVPAGDWWLWVPQEARSTSWPHALGPLGMTLLLLFGGALWMLLAAWRFRTRDIPAPL